MQASPYRLAYTSRSAPCRRTFSAPPSANPTAPTCPIRPSRPSPCRHALPRPPDPVRTDGPCPPALPTLADKPSLPAPIPTRPGRQAVPARTSPVRTDKPSQALLSPTTHSAPIPSAPTSLSAARHPWPRRRITPDPARTVPSRRPSAIRPRTSLPATDVPAHAYPVRADCPSQNLPPPPHADYPAPTASARSIPTGHPLPALPSPTTRPDSVLAGPDLPVPTSLFRYSSSAFR
jgi:hypothetical protein